MPRYEDEDDRPRSRRERDREEDEDDRPRRRHRRNDEDDADDELEDRPSRRRSRFEDEDDEDERPRRRSRRREPDGNPAAAISLTLGLLAILFNVISGIPAIVLGIIGFKNAGKYGPGKGMAIAGVACAVVCTAVSSVGIYFVWNYRSERQALNESFNNAKQIGIAMHNHHDATRQFPAAYTAPGYFGNQPAPMNQRRTSWRTGLLPYIEQNALFQRYDPVQPWDSPRNRPVTDSIVRTYADGDGRSNQTRFRVFTGPNTPFKHGQPPIGFARMIDGSSNTILMAESAERGPWGEPLDMEVSPGGAMPALGDPARKDVIILMADGSVRRSRKTIDERTLRLLVDPADGQVAPFDW